MDTSTKPNTHMGSSVRRPLLFYMNIKYYILCCMCHYTFGLWLNSDSSAWTIVPGPPSLIGVASSLVLHTSLNHWYPSIAVLLAMSASLQAVVTGILMLQRCIKWIHFWSVNFDLLKNDPVLIDLYVEQLGHRQLQPSLHALVVHLTQFIDNPHVAQFMLLANRLLLFRKSIAAVVPLAKIIGPKVDIDIIHEATKETSESTRHG